VSKSAKLGFYRRPANVWFAITVRAEIEQRVLTARGERVCDLSFDGIFGRLWRETDSACEFLCSSEILVNVFEQCIVESVR
jgi:hypothetical protein